MQLVQLIHNLGFDLVGNCGIQFALHVVADVFPEGFHPAFFDAERREKFLVQLGQLAFGNFFYGDAEGCFLAAQILSAVVVRKGCLKLAIGSGLHASHAVIEILDHLTRADDEGDVFSGTALEGLVVNSTREIDGNAVPVFDIARHRNPLLTLLTEALNHLVHIEFADLRLGLSDVDTAHVSQLDFGEDLESRRELEIDARIHLQDFEVG